MTDRPADPPPGDPPPGGRGSGEPGSEPSRSPAAQPGALAPSTPGATPPSSVPALDRRRFFRHFAGDVVQTAATVVGAAQALRDASAQAAQAILDPEAAAPRLVSVPAPPVPRLPAGTAGGSAPTAGDLAAGAGSGGAPAGFRTPFRLGSSDDVLLVIDQRRLPDALVEVEVRTAQEAAAAIGDMVVRGAPAIGQVAALGLALEAGRLLGHAPALHRARLRAAAGALVAARPTAVNLRWAVDRLLARYEAIGGVGAAPAEIARALRAEADAIVWEATIDHGRIAEFGLAELEQPEGRPLRLLTHCNTGPLACGQFGTALGIVQAAHHAGREVHVWVDETRPYLQGARLTAWELAQAGVPHTLIADVAAGHLMRRGEVDAILVGADRIAANGDTANKVGTYPLAVLAARHRVPFYVVAPLSSIDPKTPDGDAIPIEERSPDEVLEVQGRRIAPPATPARNPAFDVTPAELITGIVTEEGVLRPPYESAIPAAFDRARVRRASEPNPFAASRAATPGQVEPMRS